MAKKARKPNLPQETLERARRELERRGVAATPVIETPASTTDADALKTMTPVPARRAVVAEVDLRQQYAYVLSDLQNMGMLAAALGIVLVIMSFFI